MPRPSCMRYVGCRPKADYFKPAGIPLSELEAITLAMDEIEALRLADFEGLYQEEAAREMGVSRATFARIIEQARQKTSDALLHGKAMRIDRGGTAARWQGRPETAGGRAGKRRKAHGRE